MPTPTFRNSHIDRWNSPRPSSDPSQRFAKHGKIRPMPDDRASYRRSALVLGAGVAAVWVLIAAVIVRWA